MAFFLTAGSFYPRLFIIICEHRIPPVLSFRLRLSRILFRNKIPLGTSTTDCRSVALSSKQLQANFSHNSSIITHDAIRFSFFGLLDRFCQNKLEGFPYSPNSIVRDTVNTRHFFEKIQIFPPHFFKNRLCFDPIIRSVFGILVFAPKIEINCRLIYTNFASFGIISSAHEAASDGNCSADFFQSGVRSHFIFPEPEIFPTYRSRGYAQKIYRVLP